MKNQLNFSFKYSKIMEEYREKENVKNEIMNINISSLKAKMPYFSFDLKTDYGIIKSKIRTKKISDTEFQVLDGYGQMSFGKFIVK